ncbi:low molecular weight protein-tyrosine-phosphatase [Marinomonas posidonica]|uniref:protein-tyrosine-phosphatase n=1 Tax=Marinomonas posidonica (strain CECT 7376 / NCIMB 14433 / IVIA-Po-181) TaxID=491952 RepID=F6D165_MARPP|nr:low molecular weight protein-tyrosine-phosphatase [Marinomonas posidonica]AEF54872.1 protein tyrosine phosphatase [Marinomonas posidonica IVIA-Po-181]
MTSIRVLTVCLGNICRSPAAQGILQHEAELKGLNLSLDSAGTAAYHIGKLPDSRSIDTLKQVGIDITGQRARQVTEDDFQTFDWILAMDQANYQHLKRLQPTSSHAKLVMFGEFADHVSLGEVDDPYYGGDEGFTQMRHHLSEIAKRFLDHIASD